MREGAQAMRVLIIIAAILTAPGLMGAGLQPSEARAERPGRASQCFLPQTVRNYRTDGDHAAYVKDLSGRVFLLQTNGCRGLIVSRSIAISPTTGGSACVGEPVSIATSGPSIRGENNSVCTARIMKRLTPSEVEALPRGVRP